MTQSASSDAFNDSLSFVKKLWGGMSVPGMTVPGMSMPVPSMSLEDMDKRIQELKTVESWLTVNMTMLHSTIQALEIQRATIATLHSLSSTMAQTMQSVNSSGTSNPFAAGLASESGAAAATKSGAQEDADVAPLMSQSATWWNGVQEQFKQALGTALANSAANYEVAKSVTEDATKAATDAATQLVAKATNLKASASAAPKPPAKGATKSAPKSPAKPVPKAASKAKTGAASKTGKSV
ncbi:PhaM family polyhydroxyalkanoate granule multifunctional regulatory protein [Solimicrobium silvestre]|uniref:Uncharacterized protein n=1 Tax=Solimicrobium silvestre TaxID=2099400 RepID=A0A2S9H215_9BURK|nr:PhaM family polyhydroxyalkanoate granule multifunctional regulatory protein [Solimicrobium silvestre]PRC94022.1 hypothetical protein S2091_1195 [Solimicrobium silvestre]